MNVIDEQGGRLHQNNPQQHHGKQEPSQGSCLWMSDSHQGRCTRRRVDSACEAHDCRGKTTGKSTAQLGVLFSVWIQGEELGDANSNDACPHLAEECISRLCKWCLDGTEFDDCRSTLIKLVSTTSHLLTSRCMGRTSRTKLATMAGASRASKEGTCLETDAIRATPQKAPISPQNAVMTLPSGFTGLSRCPRK